MNCCPTWCWLELFLRVNKCGIFLGMLSTLTHTDTVTPGHCSVEVTCLPWGGQFSRDSLLKQVCSCKQPALTALLDLAWPWRLVVRQRRQRQVAATLAFRAGTSLCLPPIPPILLLLRNGSCITLTLFLISILLYLAQDLIAPPTVNVQHRGILLLSERHNMENIPDLRLSK